MTGNDILAAAIRELCVKESPAGSNRVRYNTWYYGREVSGSAYPWCMAFVQWIFHAAGVDLPYKTASCGGLLRWYKEHQPDCVIPVENARAGDIVIFDFPGGAATDHCGIFEVADKNTLTTIDGNTGAGNDANGGAVMRRTRNLDTVAAIIRPREITEQPKSEKPERYNTIAEIRQFAPWAIEVVEALIAAGAIRGGGTVDALGRPADMDLSKDMLRLLTIIDRAGGLRDYCKI